MNTIKTVVVLTTLLAVGYGAHLVLKQQPISDQFATAEGVWRDLQPSSPPANLAAMDELRPQIKLPELAQTPLDAVRSQVPTGPDGMPALLPVEAAARSRPLDQPDADIQPQSLADLRRQPVSPPTQADSFNVQAAGMATSEGVTHAVAHLPSQPAASPSPFQTADAQLPISAAPARLTPVPPDPAANRQATAQGPMPGYVADGVIPSASARAAFEDTWTAAQAEVRNGRFAVALQSLSALYRGPNLSVSQREQLVTLLDQLAGSVIYAPDFELEPAHVVQSTETLDTVAANYGLNPTFLGRVNGLSPAAPLAPGTRLKVVRGPFRAEVSLTDREITLFLGELYAGRFNCAIGRDLPAQVRDMSVVRAEGARPFVDFRTGEQISAGAANNPYGNHWIELTSASVPGTAGLGIHSFGTEIDASDTRGCVSVSPAEAVDLTAILSPGSRVVVIP